MLNPPSSSSAGRSLDKSGALRYGGVVAFGVLFVIVTVIGWWLPMNWLLMGLPAFAASRFPPEVEWPAEQVRRLFLGLLVDHVCLAVYPLLFRLWFQWFATTDSIERRGLSTSCLRFGRFVLLAMPFDFLENLGLFVLFGVPNWQPAIVRWGTTIVSLLKWGVVLSASFALLAGFLFLAADFRRQRPTSGDSS